jgi:protein-S-isoprenylcysteine O-methyltransferase Ste14
MARPRFQAWWTRFVPPAIARSTYVLVSSLVLIALFAWWQPIATPVWAVQNAIGSAALTALYFAGFGLVLYSTFLIDHFDLFGLRQVVLHFRNRDYSERNFKLPALYRRCTPALPGLDHDVLGDAGHERRAVLFALVMTGYILVAIPMEERDLAKLHGEPYRRWRSRTPAFVPRVGVRTPETAPPTAAQPN